MRWKLGKRQVLNLRLSWKSIRELRFRYSTGKTPNFVRSLVFFVVSYWLRGVVGRRDATEIGLRSVVSEHDAPHLDLRGVAGVHDTPHSDLRYVAGMHDATHIPKILLRLYFPRGFLVSFYKITGQPSLSQSPALEVEQRLRLPYRPYDFPLGLGQYTHQAGLAIFPQIRAQ